MRDITFGLQMAAVGMGIVFALLIGLMVLLLALGRLDRQPAPEPDPEPTLEADALAELDDIDSDEPAGVHIDADGLDPDTIAAITIAVLTHRDIRRRQAAPWTRTHTPGSHLYASRWLASGRAQQTRPWRGR